MKNMKINDGIYMFTMNLDDMLFENMWELPDGVSMNSYLVKGDNVAIIDGVIGWDGVPETLYEHLKTMDVTVDDIDYVVVNHMEPDHSGWLENLKKITTGFTILVTAKGAQFISSYYGDEFNIQVVKEGDTVDLGQGKVLRFHPTPNVHWPETMITYEQSTKTLFSCDMFGGFGSLSDSVFYQDLSKEEQTHFDYETVRYFSNVLTTFSPMVKRAIKKTEELDVNMIAPGHGPLYKDTVDIIINQYKRFCEYADGDGEDKIAILVGSMYGVTKAAVKKVIDYLQSKDMTVSVLTLPQATESDVVTEVFTSKGIIVAASTYEYRMFPPVAHAIDECGRKKITNKKAMYFGSYGWNASAEKDLMNIISNYRMKWEFVDPVSFEGAASNDDMSQIQKGVDGLLDLIQ